MAGLPKGVPGSHATLLEYSDGYAEITRGYLKDGEETLILANPLFHIMGQGTITGLGFNKGNTTVLMPLPEIDAILEAIQKYKGSLFLGVPALYRMVLENDRVDRYDWLRDRRAVLSLPRGGETEKYHGTCVGIAPDGALLFRPDRGALRRVTDGVVDPWT